jgi:hypothetical protein
MAKNYLSGIWMEHADTGDSILATLVEAIADQNAILDDTIHGELRRIADALELIAERVE